MLEVEILNREQPQVHRHMDVEMIYMLEGQACVQINDKEYALGANDIIMVNSNNRHCIMKGKDAGRESWWFCRISLEYRPLLEDLGSDFALFWCNSAVSDSDEYRMLTSILDEILDVWKVSESENYMKKSLYYKLVGCLAEHFLVTGMENQWSRKSRFEREEMLQYMNANYFRPVTLKEMADKMYMSETSFSKYFKKISGMNFVQYMNNIRLHHAIEDLLYSDKPMTRIAVDNGFASPSLFNRVFKSVYQMTPTEYKESAKKETKTRVDIPEAGSREVIENYLEKKALEKTDKKLEKYIREDGEGRQAYRKIWTKAIHLGDAKDILSARIQRQICFACENIPFEYGQVDNLFGWDMKLRENHTFQTLNFARVDEVLDFLIDHNIIPVIDLGDRPKSTLKDFDRAIFTSERKKVYESQEEFEKVLNLFMKHVIRRYGEENVGHWMFNVWFDPGEAYANAIVTVMEDYDYTKVFEAAAGIIKGYIPEIMVGGAGFVLGNMHVPVREFLEKAAELPWPPDFISIYTFPYCHIDENDVLGSAIRPHTRFIAIELEHYREMARSWGIEHIPLYIMEWNMSLSQRTFYNDSCGKAALMLKNMTDNLEGAWMCAYSLLSDQDSDYYDSPKTLIGAAGLLTKEGIVKPCFYALQFMSFMDQMLVARGDGYMITADRNGRYKILCFNYKAIGQTYYLRRESDLKLKDLDHLYENQLELTIHMTMVNMENGVWELRRYRISPQYGNVLGMWYQLGQEISSRSEAEYLRRMCTPRIEGEKIQCHEGTLNLTETLQAHEIRLIVLSR